MIKNLAQCLTHGMGNYLGLFNFSGKRRKSMVGCKANQNFLLSRNRAYLGSELSSPPI
jgi:hypothetical protein